MGVILPSTCFPYFFSWLFGFGLFLRHLSRLLNDGGNRYHICYSLISFFFSRLVFLQGVITHKFIHNNIYTTTSQWLVFFFKRRMILGGAKIYLIHTTLYSGLAFPDQGKDETGAKD
ncbi:hypothetical protein F4810DRAFT_695343 [Camillea tinctor]|nr:hypothetical protein F4810DRAFT_695343 [Camillea tinctor]